MLVLTLAGTLFYGENIAKAASTVRGSLNGYGRSGSISTDSTSATATTTFGRGNALIKAESTVYYWRDKAYYKSKMTASSNAGGVAATAGKCIGGADVIGGKGKHECSYDNGTYKSGGWASMAFQQNSRIVGTCWGTYT